MEFATWWGLAVAPLAWAVDEGTSYALTQHACSTGHFYVLHVVTLVCVLFEISGFVMAFSAFRNLPPKHNAQGHLPRDRAYFMIMLGMTMTVAFTVVIIAEAIPRWVLTPCT